MREFKRIIVGVELNPEGTAVSLGSQKAAQQAVWVALANKGSIRFVHSHYADDYVTPLRGSTGLVHEGVSEEARKAMEALVSEAANSGVAGQLEITSDRPWVDIIKFALQGDVDLVIVGKRAESADDGRRLGSTAIKLLRKCPAPVWVVRPEHDLVHRLVLAATDLTDVGDRAVEIACDIVTRHECELNVVHAWRVPMTLQLEASRMSDEDYATELEQIKQGAIEHVEELLPAHLHESTKIHGVKGNAAQAIRDAVGHLDPDLLVMGTVSRPGVAGLLVGSTAERMLDQVDCSILTLKPDGFVSPISL
jgi:universal stress protein E